MSQELKDKTILFFGPETFNYEKEIVAQMQQLGAQVVYRSDKPGNSFFLKALVRLFPKMLWQYSDKVLGKWLAQNAPAQCDVVLVIKGEGLSPKFIDGLRTRYPNAKFVFYLWDSIKNVRHAELKFAKFDHLYSFDSNDCKQYPIFKYRPLFFLDRYLATKPAAGKGCFFIGTMNGDRPAVISRLIRALPTQIRFDYWLFVRNDIELFLRRLFDASLKNMEPARLLRVPMSSQVVSQHFQDSAAIIDIEHPNQFGLTMRTFEVLASGKKLITTNKNIAQHDFYQPDRVCIIDRKDPQIKPDFLDAPMAPLPDSFYAKYSLQGWLLEILESVVARPVHKS
jgi:hypothetical protein